jgi:hypothetical protein
MFAIYFSPADFINTNVVIFSIMVELQVEFQVSESDE